MAFSLNLHSDDQNKQYMVVAYKIR